MKLGSREKLVRRHDPDRLDRARPRARGRRHPARPDHRDLRSGVVGQDHGLPARPCRGPGPRRRGRVHRCRARPRPRYARACGVNVDELLVSQPDTGEQALEITETLIRSGGIDCVVVDSVAALVPRAEIEGEMGDSFMGVQARLMSQALRKLTGAVSPIEHGTDLHQPAAREDRRDVRQPRDDAGWPRDEVLRHRSGSTSAASRRSRPAPNRSATASASRSSRTRSRAPFRVAEFDIMYGEGVSKEGGLLDVGVAMDTSPRPAPGSRSPTLGLGRAARHPRSSSRPIRRSLPRSTADPRQDQRRVDPGRGHRRGGVGLGRPFEAGACPADRGPTRSGGTPRRRWKIRGRSRRRGAIPRAPGAVRRRGPAATDAAGYRVSWSTARSTGCSSAGCSTTRRSHVSGSSLATGRDRAANTRSAGARPEGGRPRHDRSRARGAARGDVPRWPATRRAGFAASPDRIAPPNA